MPTVYISMKIYAFATKNTTKMSACHNNVWFYTISLLPPPPPSRNIHSLMKQYKISPLYEDHRNLKTFLEFSFSLFNLYSYIFCISWLKNDFILLHCTFFCFVEVTLTKIYLVKWKKNFVNLCFVCVCAYKWGMENSSTAGFLFH